MDYKKQKESLTINTEREKQNVIEIIRTFEAKEIHCGRPKYRRLYLQSSP